MRKNLFKLLISLIFVVMTVVCLSVLMLTDASATPSPAGSYAGGSGTEADPWQIATPAQWIRFADQINNGNGTGKYYVLTADITFNSGADATSWTKDSNPTDNLTDYRVGNKTNLFQGYFDGQGHTISGVFQSTGDSDTSKYGQGLFGETKGTTVIKNFVLTNSYIYAYNGWSGAVVGNPDSTCSLTVQNVYVTNTVRVQAHNACIGGIVGGTDGTCTISGCVNAADIRGGIGVDSLTNNQRYVGGIIGHAQSVQVTVSDCLNLGELYGKDYVSGIVGYDQHGSSTVTRCVNLGNIASGFKAEIIACPSTTSSKQPTVTYCFSPSDTPIYRCRGSNNTKITSADFITAGFLSGTGSALASNWTELASSVTVGDSTTITKEVCVPTALYNAVGAITTSLRNVTVVTPAPSWLLTAYASGTINIDTPAKWIEFAKFFNGNYDETCDDLMDGKTVNITADLTFNTGTASSWLSSFSGTDMTPYMIGDGDEDNHYVPFKGTLEGNGHVISGLYISTSQANGTGWFAMIEDATIQNLIITNSCFKTSQRKIAAVVGQMTGTSTISNVYVTDSVYVRSQTGNRSGIVSTIFDGCNGTVSNCVNAANISVASATAGDQNYAGGILGNGNSGNIAINDCLNISNITGNNYVAGIAGAMNNNSASINRCINLGTVTATGSYYGDMSNAGSGSKYVYYYNCFGIGAQACGRRAGSGVSYTTGTKYIVMEPGYIANSAFSSTWTQRSTAVDNGNNTETVTYEYPLPNGVASFTLKPALGEASFVRSLVSFSGWGTQASPYLITSVADMLALADYATTSNFSGYYFELTANITLNIGTSSDWASSAPANKLNPVGTESVPFCGKFDGKGYTFSGIYENQNEGGAGCGVGIFGVIGNGAEIKNFKIVNSYFTDGEWVGAVVGEMKGGTIDAIKVGSDVYVKASVGACAGGIAGGCVGTAADSRTITNCVFRGTVSATGTAGTGGIIGLPNSKAFSIDNCLMTGSVSSTGGTTNVGGIFGKNNYATASVTNTLYAGSGYGAYPIGNNDTQSITISGCYSSVNTANQYRKSNSDSSVGVTYIPASTYYASGSGTAGSPYMITNWGHLIVLAFETYFSDDGFSGKYFKLGNDITINDGTATDAWTPDVAIRPIGTSESAPFSGNFNGDGYILSGVYANTDQEDGTGLFGLINNATIQNLVITNSLFKTAQRKVAALVGEMKGISTIANIYVTDSVYIVTQRTVRAGIVSTLNDTNNSTISNCVNAANISVLSSTSSEQNYCGGIIGNGNRGKITINNCLNLSYINGNNFLGGIAGSIANDDSRINNCVNLGTVATRNNYGQMSNSGTNDTTVYFTNCFGITATVGGRNTSGTYTQITEDGFISDGFLAGTGSALASTWTEIASEVVDGTITTKTKEICWPTALLSALQETPQSSYYIIIVPAPSWLITAYNGGGTIDIGTVAQFEEVATFVNGNYDEQYGEGDYATAKTFRLTANLNFGGADITNLRLGVWDHPFFGTFNGQGYTVSGIVMTVPDDSGIGLFGTAAYYDKSQTATIQNIKIANSTFTAGGGTAGALVGQTRGSATISHVYVADDVTITSGGNGVGGVLGLCTGNAASVVTVSNCVNAATITLTSAVANSRRYCGGIIGNGNGKAMTVTDCLNLGDLVNGYCCVAGIVGHNPTNASYTVTIQRCVNAGNIESTIAADDGNNGRSAGIVSFGSTVRATHVATDCYTVIGTAVHSVYEAGSSSKGTTDVYFYELGASSVPSGLSSYWTARGTSSKLDCMVPSGAVAGYVPANTFFYYNNCQSLGGAGTEGSPYTISTANQWRCFSLMSTVNNFDGQYVKLAGNLSLNSGTSSDWRSSAPTNVYYPISSEELPFCGSFDGDGYTLSGLYISGNRAGLTGVAMFGSTSTGAEITNLVIDNFYIVGADWVAGVVSAVQGDTDISEIYATSSVIVEGLTGGANAGIASGCINASTFTLTVEKCVFAGTVYTGGRFSGGIVGNGNSSTGSGKCHEVDITDCLMLGYVKLNGAFESDSDKPYDDYICGILGRNDYTTNITNCIYASSGRYYEDNEDYGYTSFPIARVPLGDGSYDAAITDCVTIVTNNNGTSGQVYRIGTSASTPSAGICVRVPVDDLCLNTVYSGFTNWTARGTVTDNGTKITYVYDIMIPTVSTWRSIPTSKYYGTHYGFSGVTSMTGRGTETDPYIISNAAGLAELAAKAAVCDTTGMEFHLSKKITVNSGTAAEWNDENLPAVISRPIGTETMPFNGIFDGYGKTISGLYMGYNLNESGEQETGYGVGLFGKLGPDAVVTNVKIANSLFKDSKWVGAVAGESDGARLHRVWIGSDVIVQAIGDDEDTNAIAGGLVGGILPSASTTAIFTYCSFNGTVVGNGDYVGGMVGVTSNKAVTVQNCLNAGTVIGASKVSGLVGYDTSSSCEVSYSISVGTVTATGDGAYSCAIINRGATNKDTSNCYYLTGSADYGTYKNNASGGDATAKTIEQIMAIDFVLENWLVRSSSTTEGALTTTQLDIPVPYLIKNFAPKSPFYTLTVVLEGDLFASGNGSQANPWKITSYADLVQLSSYSRQSTLSGVYFQLTTDINGGGATFLPIGNEVIPFGGIFDGNGHSISGIRVTANVKYTVEEDEESGDITRTYVMDGVNYVTGSGYGAGLFGCTAGGATVKNLKLLNSTITDTEWVGGVIAEIKGDTTVQNVYVGKDVTVRATSKSSAGGIVGGMITVGEFTLDISDSMFCGEVSANQMYAGGIVGNNDASPDTGKTHILNVTNCMNVGTISGESYVAGIVGRGDCFVTITGCINAGSIIADNDVIMADIWTGKCSSDSVNDASATITGNYYIGSQGVLNYMARLADAYTASGNTRISYLELFGSSARTISGYTKRAADIMVPNGCASYAEQLFTIKIESGASVRTKSPYGIRFISEINKAYFDALEVQEYGILLAPTNIIEAVGGFDIDALDEYATAHATTAYVRGRAIVNMKNNNPATDGYYKFSFVLNVAERNYQRDFSAVAYCIDGEGNMIISDYHPLHNSRSVADVARLACEDISETSGNGYTQATTIQMRNVTESYSSMSHSFSYTDTGNYNSTTIYRPYTSAQITELQKYFANELRVMEQNLLVGYKSSEWPNDPESSYQSLNERALRLAKQVEKYQPDIIGFSEDLKGWHTMLSNSPYFTSTYTLLYSANGSAWNYSNNSDSNMIAFRTSRFTKNSEGIAALGGNYNTSTGAITSTNTSLSNGYLTLNGGSVQSNDIRTVRWASLTDNVSGKTFVFASAHFDHIGDNTSANSDQIRLGEAKRLQAELNSIENAGSIGAIVVGDLNANSSSLALTYLTTDYLKNNKNTADLTYYNTYYTAHDFSDKKEFQLDYCLYKDSYADALRFRIVKEKYVGLTAGHSSYVSDHYGLINDFILK